jgi:hypothetical protein
MTDSERLSALKGMVFLRIHFRCSEESRRTFVAERPDTVRGGFIAAPEMKRRRKAHGWAIKTKKDGAPKELRPSKIQFV